MIIKVNAPVSFSVDKLTDLPKLRDFMQDNNIKVNKSELARQLNVDRRTVSKYLDGFEKSKTRNKPSKLDAFYEDIKALLSSPTQLFQYKSVLYRYLKENYNMDVPEQTFYHYIKSTPEFDQYFRQHKRKQTSAVPVIRFETAPAEQAQFDWKESVPFVLKDTGESITVNILVLILGYSRLKIFQPSLWMTRDVLIHLLTETFETIGGVPRTLVTDNMKTVMDDARTGKDKGKINAQFEAFRKDFGFELKPCVAARPQTKGKVESQMKFLDEIKAYSGTLDLVGLFGLIRRLNCRVNNTICKGTGRIPAIEFEKERKGLLPLPTETVMRQYRIKTSSVSVNTAAMINIQGNQYSVPSSHIGAKVEYQIHESNIYVYHNNELIAVHPVSDRKLNYTPDHYQDILSQNYAGKNSDEVSRMAKRNLEIIGGIYSNG